MPFGFNPESSEESSGFGGPPPPPPAYSSKPYEEKEPKGSAIPPQEEPTIVAQPEAHVPSEQEYGTHPMLLAADWRSTFSLAMNLRDVDKARNVARFTQNSPFLASLGFAMASALAATLTSNYMLKGQEWVRNGQTLMRALYITFQTDKALLGELAKFVSWTLAVKWTGSFALHPTFEAKESRTGLVIGNAKYRPQRRGYYVGFGAKRRFLLIPDRQKAVWYLMTRDDSTIAEIPAARHWTRGAQVQLEDRLGFTVLSTGHIRIPATRNKVVTLGLSNRDKFVIDGQPDSLSATEWAFIMYIIRSMDTVSLSLLVAVPAFLMWSQRNASRETKETWKDSSMLGKILSVARLRDRLEY